METKIFLRFQPWKISISAWSTFNKGLLRRSNVKIDGRRQKQLINHDKSPLVEIKAEDFIQIIQSQQKAINELTKAIGTISAAQFLFFRLFTQYDPKLAHASATALEYEQAKYKQQQEEPPYHPYHGEHLKEFLEIARNPTQPDKKGRPLWIRLVVDNQNDRS